MAAAAHRLGHQYIAITDHSKALAMANGLDEQRALEHAARIRALNGRFEGLTLLAGIECDILADGTLDLADDCLAQLDIVVASVHSHFTQDEAQMTDRVLRALECPWVDVLGHPTGRLLLQARAAAMDMPVIVAAAAARGVALEINCQVERLDLNDVHARLARERGVRLVISTDAHFRARRSSNLRWGVQMARRGWLRPATTCSTPEASTSCAPAAPPRTEEPPDRDQGRHSGFVALKSLKTGPRRRRRRGARRDPPDLLQDDDARRSTTTSPTPSSCSRRLESRRTARRRRSSWKGWQRDAQGVDAEAESRRRKAAKQRRSA